MRWGGVVPRYFPLFVLRFYDGKHKKKPRRFLCSSDVPLIFAGRARKEDRGCVQVQVSPSGSHGYERYMGKDSVGMNSIGDDFKYVWKFCTANLGENDPI